MGILQSLCPSVFGGGGQYWQVQQFPAQHKTFPAGHGGAIILWARPQGKFRKRPDRTGPLNAVHRRPPSGRTDCPVENTVLDIAMGTAVSDASIGEQEDSHTHTLSLFR